MEDQLFSTLPFLSLNFFLQNEGPEAEKAIREECATDDGDVGENEIEDDEGRTIYPYERLTTKAEDPIPDIDVTKREVSKSSSISHSSDQMMTFTYCLICDDIHLLFHLNAVLLIVGRVQREVRHDKGGILQASQVEAEQTEVWCSALLACLRSRHSNRL